MPDNKPWTAKKFANSPRNFQFAIIGDRTGGANVQETFKLAMGQINLLQPEFVINVGDVVEGYSDQKAELHAEWDGIDKLLNTLEMPFFRTPGNHDIANKTAQEVCANVSEPRIIPSFTKTCCSWCSTVKMALGQSRHPK